MRLHMIVDGNPKGFVTGHTARRAPQSDQEKMKSILDKVHDAKWTYGEFLMRFFGGKDHETEPNSRHHAMLKAFLCGQSQTNTAAHVVDTMYQHPLSEPKSTHPDASTYFELDKSIDEINYAQPGIATWALRLITDTMGEEFRYLKSPDAGLRVRAGGIKAAAARRATNEAAAAEGAAVAAEEGAASAEEVAAVEGNTPEEVGDGGAGEGSEAGEDDAMDVDDDVPSVGPSTTAAQTQPLRKPKGTTSKDPVVSWDIIGQFSIPKLAAKFQKHAPVTWQIMTSVLKAGRKATETYRPTETIAASVISELVFGNNSWTNLFAMCRGIALFGTMAHQSVYRVGSRLAQCIPYTTACEALVTMSTIERASLIEKFAKPNVDTPPTQVATVCAFSANCSTLSSTLADTHSSSPDLS
ncbi:hypothetical protein FA95DRAFT_1606303 [Auriscalpium vulgare]|uniref:Uncharacterized protein n=1 Tax=Auriscalpium vulgare TaxID=40419 RepID=A0ACB8RSE3_9AGAM|nr:hypothetical protein FA95DRAFT_1606303 [Auriscalpium vulgare]